jgi:hypothetical protein
MRTSNHLFPLSGIAGVQHRWRARRSGRERLGAAQKPSCLHDNRRWVGPDGPKGNVLPNLIVEIVDSATIDLNAAQPSSGGGVVAAGAVRLVQ